MRCSLGDLHPIPPKTPSDGQRLGVTPRAFHHFLRGDQRYDNPSPPNHGCVASGHGKEYVHLEVLTETRELQSAPAFMRPSWTVQRGM